MKKRTDFLYLSEPDMIKAGVLNYKRCIDVEEEVFGLLSKGDYVMGGDNFNSHGIMMKFPKESPFPNMPTDAPDRRFMAMPAYVGGRFNVAGQKWYGSNIINPQRGLPRSILMVMLNDADTCEPLALMSGNLVSSVRTGCVPGVATRHLARKGAEVCSCIGAGPVSKACFEAIALEAKNLKELAQLISKMEVMICSDSAPMHIGVAVGTKTIAIFGPTDEKKLLPQDPNFVAVTTNCDCRPCLWDKRNTSCENLYCLNFDTKNIDPESLKTDIKKINSEVKL